MQHPKLPQRAYSTGLILVKSLLIIFCATCRSQNGTIDKETGALSKPAADRTSINQDPVPPGLKRLLLAYPDFLKGAEGGYLIWNDGTRMLYDDGREKSFEKMLDSADLEDQMKQAYPARTEFRQPEVDCDPGRIRNELFFRKMYGGTKSEVEKKLTEITWLPGSKKRRLLRVTTVNGVDSLLQAISNELDTLQELHDYVDNPAGTFIFREIMGTSRLSMHSFGIAIDINVNRSDYWKWKHPKKGSMLRCDNKVPLKIVELFERRGFIWGGRWYHFDTMHFEYRPELFVTTGN
jgi:peptidoglycan L-alanyl-D-glutamate endopeptidase CwlK